MQAREAAGDKADAIAEEVVAAEEPVAGETATDVVAEETATDAVAEDKPQE
jgi:hypothetical protein